MPIERTPLSRAIRAQLAVPLMRACLLALAMASVPALAQDEFSLDGDEPMRDTAELLKEQTEITSMVEVGLGFLSDDAFRYGRYTGLTDEGVFAVLGFDIFKRGAWDGDDPTWWRAQAENLGLDSREASFDYGRQGQWAFRLGFDQTPHNHLDTTRTIFTNPGATSLTLPSNWVGGQNTAGMTRLTESLRPFDVEHERRRFDIGFDWIPAPKWNLETAYSREEKDGLKTIGLTIGNSGGNPRAVLAPEPVDYLTQTADVALTFARPDYQIRVGYYMSLFDNENSALRWQNPYSNINGWTSAGFPAGSGQKGLAPDNEFHQIYATGGWTISDTMRLTGDLSYGRATQDEPFLPYTINPVLAASITQPLPRLSLDGRVDSTYAALRFSHRPTSTLYWNANLRYDDRDNRTPHDEYVYIGGDSNTQNTAANSGFRRFNEPKSQEQTSFRLDGTWRALDWLRIAGDAQWKRIDRPHQERERLDEDRYTLSFTNTATGLVSGGLRLSVASRDGSEYRGYETFINGYAPGYTNAQLPFVGGFPFENLPGMRKFNQADRDRRQAEVFGNLALAETVALGLNVNYSEDDYDNSEFGLTFSRVNGYNADLTWAPSEVGSLYGFYSVERYKNDQNGRAWSNRSPQSFDPNRNWTTRSRDDLDTWGLGAIASVLEGKFKVGVDYVRAKTDADVLTTTGPALVSAPLPTARTDLTSASIYGDWAWRKDTTVRVRFAYEDYATTDWAVDNVPANQLANVILLGEDSPDYNVWVASLAFVYRF
ncbi:MAG: MtrB/PioB family decaheme-associated outer membrane protein [Pseudomonadota bacterium]